MASSNRYALNFALKVTNQLALMMPQSEETGRGEAALMEAGQLAGMVADQLVLMEYLNQEEEDDGKLRMHKLALMEVLETLMATDQQRKVRLVAI